MQRRGVDAPRKASKDDATSPTGRKDETHDAERVESDAPEAVPKEEPPPPPPPEAKEVSRFAEGFVEIYHSQHPDLVREEARAEVMELLAERAPAPRAETPPPGSSRSATSRFMKYLVAPSRGTTVSRGG